AAEPLHARDGREHGLRLREELLALLVEVVRVVVVRDEHEVEREEPAPREERLLRLRARETDAEPVALAGRIERGVGQDAEAADLEEERRRPYVREPHAALHASR